MRVAILTISDSVSRGKHKDASGPGLVSVANSVGKSSPNLLPTNRHDSRPPESLADSGAADLMLTTGGTGIGPRDSTPEATVAACEKLLPGISELMREEAGRKSARGSFSRRRRRSRPRFSCESSGQPDGAVESLDAVADLLPHACKSSAARATTKFNSSLRFQVTRKASRSIQ